MNLDQPKFLILSIALVVSHTLSGQQSRTISGTVRIDGEPLIGQSVIQYGTQNGTITHLKGKFGLTIPTGITVLLHFPQCFTQAYLLIEPDTDFVEIDLNRKFLRRSRRAYKKWKRSQRGQSKTTNAT